MEGGGGAGIACGFNCSASSISFKACWYCDLKSSMGEDVYLVGILYLCEGSDVIHVEFVEVLC